MSRRTIGVIVALPCAVFSLWFSPYCWPILSTARALWQPAPCNEADWPA